MSFVKKMKNAISNIFGKKKKVETIVEEVKEEVQEVVKKTSDVIDYFEIHHDKLEKYIDLFIDVLLWKYTSSGKVIDLFAKEFPKVLNPVYKKIAREVKNKLDAEHADGGMTTDTYDMLQLADKAIFSKKIAQHIRRKILIHIVEKLTPDCIEKRLSCFK